VTVDARVGEDLAALGRDDRGGVPGLDGLRALARPAAVAAVSVPTFALLAAAGVHARRVGQIASGATALALAVLLLCARPLCVVTDRSWGRDCGLYGLVPLAVLCMLAVRSVAVAIGEPRLDRALQSDDPLQRARWLAARLDVPALALAIAGYASFAVVLGKLVFVLGGDRDVSEWASSWRGRLDSVFDQTIADTAVAVAAVVAAAVAIAVGVVHGRVSFTRAAILALGSALGTATVSIGARFDVGPMATQFMGAGEPSHALRIALTAAGSLSVVLVVGWLAARHRLRELEELA
jgi:hypothetical protein